MQIYHAASDAPVVTILRPARAPEHASAGQRPFQLAGSWRRILPNNRPPFCGLGSVESPKRFRALLIRVRNLRPKNVYASRAAEFNVIAIVIIRAGQLWVKGRCSRSSTTSALRLSTSRWIEAAAMTRPLRL